VKASKLTLEDSLIST